MATRDEKFKTPHGASVEKVAFESYVDSQIAQLKKYICDNNSVKVDIAEDTPFSNTTYIISSALTIKNPNSESITGYPKIYDKNSSTPDTNLYSPNGIRISIIATDSCSLTINEVEQDLVNGQYYEFIYYNDNWYMINSWYARWK